jgi:Uma2 family endonuclease
VVAMSSGLRLDDDRVWTPADLDELPEDVDWRRFEIVDGALVVSPHATPRHDLFVAELILALGPRVPDGYRVIASSMIDLSPSYRIPDVTVLADRVFREDLHIVIPADVLLAIEIESPSSITTDRVTKPAQYAAAGFEHFWRLETAPLRLHAYQLAGDAYTPSGSWSAEEVARIDEPFRVEIDLSALLPD